MNTEAKEFDRAFMDLYTGADGGMKYVRWMRFIHSLGETNSRQADVVRACMQTMTSILKSVTEDSPDDTNAP